MTYYFDRYADLDELLSLSKAAIDGLTMPGGLVVPRKAERERAATALAMKLGLDRPDSSLALWFLSDLVVALDALLAEGRRGGDRAPRAILTALEGFDLDDLLDIVSGFGWSRLQLPRLRPPKGNHSGLRADRDELLGALQELCIEQLRAPVARLLDRWRRDGLFDYPRDPRRT